LSLFGDSHVKKCAEIVTHDYEITAAIFAPGYYYHAAYPRQNQENWLAWALPNNARKKNHSTTASLHTRLINTPVLDKDFNSRRRFK